MNESQTLIKLGPLPEIVGENSTAFHPYEARQQLGWPLFLLDEWAPPYKATPKMGCWNQIHKMRRVTFCLTIFSSPDNKHNIALSSNYDLRMLHNTKHMIFFPLCAHSTGHATDDEAMTRREWELQYVLHMYVWIFSSSFLLSHELKGFFSQLQIYTEPFKQSHLQPF